MPCSGPAAAARRLSPGVGVARASRARISSATAVVVVRNRSSRRGRGPSPRAALPDAISGLSYRGGGARIVGGVEDADGFEYGASVSANAAVSQLSARGEQQQLRRGQQAQPVGGGEAAATVSVKMVGGWPLIGTLFLASISSVAICGTVFIVVMAPALKVRRRCIDTREDAWNV